MSEVRRTFHVGPSGLTRPIVLRSTRPGFWKTRDDVLFQYLGHAWLGPKGRRYRIEKWVYPHSDHTFHSLQAALDHWARAGGSQEKKTSQQLDAEIAEVLERGARA